MGAIQLQALCKVTDLCIRADVRIGSPLLMTSVVYVFALIQSSMYLSFRRCSKVNVHIRINRHMSCITQKVMSWLSPSNC